MYKIITILIYKTVFLYFSYLTLILYKLNNVGVDAFLLLANYIHSFLYRLIPVEYLQLWRGFFAGITLLDREALLLGVKVEAKEQSLEYGAMHYRAKVPPNPTQPNCYLQMDSRPSVGLGWVGGTLAR